MNQLTIEWQHLMQAGDTCTRCRDTGETLHESIERLNRACRARGWEIRLVESALDPEAVAESNRIFLNGVPLEAYLPGAQDGSSHCRSCSDIIGTPTQCRTLEWSGQRHAAIPGSAIRQAVCRAAGCC